MANAWEGENFTHNLDVLARLKTLPVKTKLRYNDGRFDIEDRYFEGLRRMRSGDSVTSDDKFASPLRRVLQTARGRIGGDVTQVQFDNALAGLARLRRTYEGDADKLRSLDTILKEVDGAVQLGREGSENGQKVIALRQAFADYLVYAVRQRNYLNVGQNDVCHFFVFDWARRILSGKESYAVRSRGRGPFTPALSLTPAEHARMQKKVNHIAQAQEAERARGRAVRSAFPDYPKFANIRTSPDGCDEYGRIDPAAADKGHCFRAIRVWAQTDARTSDGVFLLLLMNEGPGPAHALGLRIYGDAHDNVQIFDPNVGEFRFMRGAEDSFQRFCTALMTNLYTQRGALLFNLWTISRVSRIRAS
jgi:hypothetical protein